MPSRFDSNLYLVQIAAWLSVGDSHEEVARKLGAQHGVKISVRTLRRWLKQHNVPQPNARTPMDTWSRRLDELQGEVIQLIESGSTHPMILEHLSQHHRLSIPERSFQRWLQATNISSQRSPADTPELRARIEELFRQGLGDSEAVAVLEADGFVVGLRTMRRIRSSMGCLLKLHGEAAATMDKMIAEGVYDELASGHVEDLGKTHMHSFMRKKYGVVGRDRIYAHVRRLNPEGVARRAAKAIARRGALVIPGPNHLWSMDAYCKLELYGIQIYAAIDSYSRYMIWTYVGPSARSQVSVAAQYIATVIAAKGMPKYLRTDRGAETTLAADIHYCLSTVLRPNEDLQPLRFSDCFKYGTSKQNSRIESWWNQQSKGAISRWRSYFDELAANGEYISDSIADRVAFKAIYIPIIRQELADFTNQWNQHKIRKQKNRPYLVSGKPNMLYLYPELSEGIQCGITVPSELIQPFREQISDFDLDEYLPPSTLLWCRQFLQSLGLDSVDGRQSHATGERLHRIAYIQLRDATRNHHLTRADPVFEEVLAPLPGRWQPSAATQLAFAAAGLPMAE